MSKKVIFDFSVQYSLATESAHEFNKIRGWLNIFVLWGNEIKFKKQYTYEEGKKLLFKITQACDRHNTFIVRHYIRNNEAHLVYEYGVR